MSCGGKSCVRSTMVASGARVRMTPFMVPTYGSERPKSVVRVRRGMGVQAFRRSGVQVFRCSGVQVLGIQVLGIQVLGIDWRWSFVVGHSSLVGFSILLSSYLAVNVSCR